MEKRSHQGTRINWLDVLKGILIIFVILSHSYPPKTYRYFFTPFFLTMFFWVSGYTFSLKNNFVEFIVNKCKRLLIPFLILGSSRVVLSYIMLGGNLWQRVKGFLLQISCRDDEMWFVACLFTASILFYLVCRMSKRWSGMTQDIFVLLVSLMFLVVSMVNMCVWKIRFPWQLEIAGMMVFYMALGYLHRKHEGVIERYLKSIVCISVLSVAYGALVFGWPNVVDIHSEAFQKPVLFWITSIIVVLPILFVAKRLAATRGAGIFIFFGQNTLFYYAFGGIVRVVLYTMFDMENFGNEYVLSLVCTVLTMFVLAFPAWIVKKYFSWAVGGWR